MYSFFNWLMINNWKSLKNFHVISVLNVAFNMEKYTYAYFKTKICKLRGNKCYHWISWFISLLSALIGLEEKSFHTQLNTKFTSLCIKPIISVSGYKKLFELEKYGFSLSKLLSEF